MAMKVDAQNLMQLFECVEIPIFFCDSKFRLISANRAYCKMLGLTPEEILGRIYWEIFPLGGVFLEKSNPQSDPSNIFSNNVEFKFQGRTFHSYEYKISSLDSKLQIYFHALADITGAALVKKSLEYIAIKDRLLFERNPDAVLLVEDYFVMEMNQAVLLMFGCNSRDEMLYYDFTSKFLPPFQPSGESSKNVISLNIARAVERGSCNFECTFCRMNDSNFFAQVQLIAFELEGKNYIQAAIKDVSNQKASISHLEEIAFKDPLTQLSTRRLLDDRLNQVLLKSKRSKQYAALFFIDLDQFKRLNDVFGHHIGDLRLQDVAKRIASCLRIGDTVARIGGDEFVVLINEFKNELSVVKPQVLEIAEKLVKALSAKACYEGVDRKPCRLADVAQCACSASIGVVIFSGDGQSGEQLLELADAAMYTAKRAGGNQYWLYDAQKGD
ncbi:MAG: diguanylate cyclase [Pseudomonadota bacterium]